MRTAQAIAAMEFLRGRWLNEDYQISRKCQYNKVSQCMKQERKPRPPSPAPTPSQSALVSAKWQSRWLKYGYQMLAFAFGRGTAYNSLISPALLQDFVNAGV